MSQKNEERKLDILKYINEYIDQHEVSPSIYKIAAALGIVPATVSKYIDRLEKEKLIVRRGRNQIIPIASDGGKVNVPILGAIPCGPLSEQYEDVEGYVKLPISLVGNGNYYLLRTFGESMVNAGIDDGDLVLIRQQEDANNGDIVVAFANGGNTLKRYYRDDEHRRIILRPENDDMEDIIVKECQIQGVAITVTKELK